MKKQGKERLFEMMSKVDKSFKPMLNENLTKNLQNYIGKDFEVMERVEDASKFDTTYYEKGEILKLVSVGKDLAYFEKEVEHELPILRKENVTLKYDDVINNLKPVEKPSQDVDGGFTPYSRTDSIEELYNSDTIKLNIDGKTEELTYYYPKTLLDSSKQPLDLQYVSDNIYKTVDVDRDYAGITGSEFTTYPPKITNYIAKRFLDKLERGYFKLHEDSIPDDMNENNLKEDYDDDAMAHQTGIHQSIFDVEKNVGELDFYEALVAVIDYAKKHSVSSEAIAKAALWKLIEKSKNFNPDSNTLNETDKPYDGKEEKIKNEILKLRSTIDGRPPTVFVDEDGYICVSAEDGSYFADYYNEFGDGLPTIDNRLEKIADKYGMYWDWKDPGSIFLAY